MQCIGSLLVHHRRSILYNCIYVYIYTSNYIMNVTFPLQITATPTMAVPVLAFLSGLVPSPSLHRGFTEQEYLSVFAIVLPYTNHQRWAIYQRTYNIHACILMKTSHIFCILYYKPPYMHRYTPYVIALAHRVISQWFVNCRLQCRPYIASFILKVNQNIKRCFAYKYQCSCTVYNYIFRV